MLASPTSQIVQLAPPSDERRNQCRVPRPVARVARAVSCFPTRRSCCPSLARANVTRHHCVTRVTTTLFTHKINFRVLLEYYVPNNFVILCNNLNLFVRWPPRMLQQECSVKDFRDVYVECEGAATGHCAGHQVVESSRSDRFRRSQKESIRLHRQRRKQTIC